MKHWRDFTLGEIADELESMERTRFVKDRGCCGFMSPRGQYVIAKHALEQIKSLYGNNTI